MSDRGVCRIVLPKKARKTAEQELQAGSVQRDVQKRSDLRIRSAKAGAVPSGETFKRAIGLLERYFSGKPVLFDLPLDIGYYTSFQQAVWRAAMKIPSGETRSYAWIAERIKSPRAARAVGQAMGANPIPVIIP